MALEIYVGITGIGIVITYILGDDFKSLHFGFVGMALTAALVGMGWVQ